MFKSKHWLFVGLVRLGRASAQNQHPHCQVSKGRVVRSIGDLLQGGIWKVSSTWKAIPKNLRPQIFRHWRPTLETPDPQPASAQVPHLRHRLWIHWLLAHGLVHGLSQHRLLWHSLSQGKVFHAHDFGLVCLEKEEVPMK